MEKVSISCAFGLRLTISLGRFQIFICYRKLKLTILHRVFSEDEPLEVLEDRGHYAEGGYGICAQRPDLKYASIFKQSLSKSTTLQS